MCQRHGRLFSFFHNSPQAASARGAPLALGFSSSERSPQKWFQQIAGKSLGSQAHAWPSRFGMGVGVLKLGVGSMDARWT